MSNLIMMIWIYIAILTYQQVKKNLQEIILDIVRIIITPIGLIWKILLYLKKKILNMFN